MFVATVTKSSGPELVCGTMKQNTRANLGLFVNCATKASTEKSNLQRTLIHAANNDLFLYDLQTCPNVVWCLCYFFQIVILIVLAF